MAASLKATKEAYERLRTYEGRNPYILTLKRDVFVNNKGTLTDFNIDYINRNWDKEPQPINRMTRIADWFAQTCKESWGTEFLPEKLKVLHLLGETEDKYHCYVQYRKSCDPVLLFIPKRAVLKNFLVDDYNKVVVDFDRYDRLAKSRAQDGNGRTLLPHQKEAIKFLLSRKKCVLADDMGLGKSCEVTVAALEGNFDVVLIVCPASLKTNWLTELSYYIPEREISIIGGVNDMRKDELEKYLGYGVGRSGKNVGELLEEAKNRGKWTDNRFVIINYDILSDVYTIPESRSKENIQKAYSESPLLQFLNGKKTLIILDEAHRLSNLKAGRYKIISDLIKRAHPDSLYLVTGTPITNDPENYYNLLYLIGDPVTDNWQYYMERYCNAIKIPINDHEKEKRDRISTKFIAQKGKRSWKELTAEEKSSLAKIVAQECKLRTVPNGVSNLEELRDKTAHIYLRRTKEDLNSLPEKYYQERRYNLTPEQYEEYNRLWDEYEEEKKNINPDAELNKELIEGGLYRHYLANQMVPHTIALADRCIAKGEKVVIACAYDDEIYTLRDYYKDKCVVYNGKISVKEKDAARDRFLNDPTVMVFLGNIQAAGVGLTLTSSRVLIFSSFSYVPGENRQMEDRIYRIGQKRDVYVFYQFFIGTQYEKMWDTVLKKALTIEKVIKKESEKN
jgi:SWI/SNF-related matrix-associated actin-dependent regulator 1 of chromatin subfamily A